MRILLCTLCLNEADILERHIQHHLKWPDRVGHIYVEGSDPLYDRKNDDGLSIDDTTSILKNHFNVEHIPVGIFDPSLHDRPIPSDQYKAIGRDVYLRAAEKYDPDWIIVVDADEFYPQKSMDNIVSFLSVVSNDITSITVPQIHLWRPPVISYRPVRFAVTGRYWSVPHVRIFRYRPEMTYIASHDCTRGVSGDLPAVNHNWPAYRGETSHANSRNVWMMSAQCYHYGFAPRDFDGYKADLRYYAARGEMETRNQTYRCRKAFLEWQPTWSDHQWDIRDLSGVHVDPFKPGAIQEMSQW